MSQPSLEQTFQLAIQHHQAGRLREAEILYRQILARTPSEPAVLHLMGVLAGQANQNDTSIELISRAISISPNVPIYHNDLGESCRRASRFDQAIASFHRAIELDPDFAQAHNNLGVALIHNNELTAAIASFRRAVQLSPTLPMAHSNLGNALTTVRQFDDAILSYTSALQLQPNYPEAHYNLANAFKEIGRLDNAIKAYEKCISIKPDYAPAHANLGSVLILKNLHDQAIASITTALRLNPRQPIALSNLGNAYLAQGRITEAQAAYRNAISLDPESSAPHSNLLYSFNFDPDCDPSAVLKEHLLWNQCHAEPLRKFIQSHPNDRDPNRRLKIGYVSPDFYNQAESFFVVPLLQSHNHDPFEIHCYASVARPDEITQRLRNSADHWHDVLALDDEQLSQKIRHDRIDILIDLTMHMAHNRLLLFARKPAPIQVTWLAYPGSTGLDTIDYRFTDPYLDPPGDTPFYSEQSIRLQSTWCCYDPLSDLPPSPPREPGPIRFASLNNSCKINLPTLKLWAPTLLAIPDATLLLLSVGLTHQNYLRQQIESLNINPARLQFLPRCSRPDYLRAYHRIDIALDPLPYNGITTTCDALWMGTPVVTMTGNTAAGRAGLSLLSNMDMPELVARTPDQFTQIATHLASDTHRLANLRSALRQRMKNSPLMDAPKFARNIEAAYRQIWRSYQPV